MARFYSLYVFVFILLFASASSTFAESSGGGEPGSDSGGFGLCGFFETYPELLEEGAGDLIRDVTIQSERWLSFRGMFPFFNNWSHNLDWNCFDIRWIAP